MKRFLPSIVCGFGAAVLTTIPGLKNFGCCLIVPVAAYFALFLDRKINNYNQDIVPSKAVAFGIMTGIFAAIFSTIFEVLMTYILKTNEFVATFPELNQMLKTYFTNPAFAEAMTLLKRVEQEITAYGFSSLYLIFFFLNSIIVNFVFGIAGGLFGMYFINKKSNIK